MAPNSTVKRTGDMPPEQLEEVVKAAVEQQVNLTKEELKTLVADGVTEAFTRLGMDPGSPLEMQRDFQHLRDWRLAVQATRKKGLITLVSVLVTGVIGLVWLGFKEFFQVGG